MSEENPYASPSASVEAEAIVGELVLANRGMRLGAAIIDGLISVVVAFPALYAIGYARRVGLRLQWSAASFGVSVSAAAIYFLVYALVQGWPLSSAGQTWGKKMLNLRIVDEDGRRPGLARLLFLRYGVTRLVGLIPFAGALYWLIDVCFIFANDRRCVHDHIAGTRVVVVK